MKSIRYLFIAALIFTAAVFVSCGGSDTVQDLYGGTYNQWYKYNGSQNTILLGSSEDDSSARTTLKSIEVYCKFDPSSGFIVALQAATSQNVDIFGGLSEASVKVIAGGKKEYTLAQFNLVKWIALYTTVPLTKASTPKIISDPDSCIMLDNIDNFKIQWKKVLVNILLTKLLGE